MDASDNEKTNFVRMLCGLFQTIPLMGDTLCVIEGIFSIHLKPNIEIARKSCCCE